MDETGAFKTIKVLLVEDSTAIGRQISLFLGQSRVSRFTMDQAGDLKTAIIMTKRAVSPETARQLLQKNGGIVRRALMDA